MICIRQASGSLFMVVDIVLCCHTKRFKKTDQGHFRVVSKGANDVLTNDKLVAARGTLRESRHGCLYIGNEHPRGFRLLNRV